MTRTTRFKRMAPAVVLSAAAALGATASFATVASAATKGAVEKPNKGTITETGSTLMYPLWNLWAPGYSTTYPSVAIQTAGTGSGTGITDASNGTADIGASDAYLSPAEVQATPALLNIPQAISAQLVVYNVPGVTAHLKLSGGILAEIYQGKITTWNDAAISAINPGVTLPSTPIVTLHRSDSSGDTFLFSSFLSATSPSWKSSIGFNTTVPWPNAPGALAENGNSGMVAGCKATVGCVAYVGISYLTQVLQSGLNYAALQNGHKQYTLPTAAAINAAAASFVKATPPNGTISLIYSKAAGSYPIINYEYAIVDGAQSSSATAKSIRSVLEWSIEPTLGNSSTYLSQVDFQPLPAKVVAQSLKQIAKIK